MASDRTQANEPSTPIQHNAMTSPSSSVPSSQGALASNNVDERHGREIRALQQKISNAESQVSRMESLIAETQAKLNALQPPHPREPSAIVKRHIHLLHEYNEIKDIGEGLLALIADARGVRYVDVQQEFGVGQGD